MACFEPRHGFKMTGPDGTYEFLLCFQCLQAHVYLADGSFRRLAIHGGGEALNHFLVTHHIPLPKH